MDKQLTGPTFKLERALSRRVRSDGDFAHPIDRRGLLRHQTRTESHRDVIPSIAKDFESVLQSGLLHCSEDASKATEIVTIHAKEPQGYDSDDCEDLDYSPPLVRRLTSDPSINRSSNTSEKKRLVLVDIDMTLDDFAEAEYIAQGAMCQCFKTTWSESSSAEKGNEKIILKVPIDGGPEEAENDLQIEILVLRQIRHPNIVQLVGAGTIPGGKSFAALEFLVGGTLRERLDRCGGGLGLKAGMKYGQQLASALEYLHDQALHGKIVMHRDLKPANVGFGADGSLKLFDFGLAKAFSRKKRGMSCKYNMTGESGSPRYMAPEVALGSLYNEKADVYSFGIVLWEMITGRLPYAGFSLQIFHERVVQKGERPLLQFSWPVDVKKLLESAWAPNIDDRVSSREANVVLKAIARDLESLPKKRGIFSR
ncbi:unnamed protein product [Choristocarpus tenellus]